MAGGQPWYAGTGTLVGVVVGVLVGFVFDQPPIGVALGLAIGAGLDTWFQRRQGG
jgi:uncharacterized membrane protein